MAGLTYQWKADRTTCTPSHGKRFQLSEHPRVVCKKEGVGTLAVLTCAVVAPWVPGTVGASQGRTASATITPSTLAAPHSSLWLLLHCHEDGFPLLNPVGFCGTQGMENTNINCPKDNLIKEWQRMKSQVPLIHRRAKSDKYKVTVQQKLGFHLIFKISFKKNPKP